MAGITIEQKYKIAIEMVSDFSNEILSVAEFSTPETVDASIELILSHDDKNLFGMMINQQSEERH
jgi:putative AlgH/UPF0301 family transcriptional regulator